MICGLVHMASGDREKHLLSSLELSPARLRLDYVDVFYSHRPDPKTPLEETIGALVTAVNQGKALYVGLSKYPLKKLKKAVKLLREQNVRCLVYQPPFSLLNRWPEAMGIHDWLEDEGIGSVVFSPLAQGQLTSKYLANIPLGSRAERKDGFLTPTQVEDNRGKVEALNELAKDMGIPLHHLALRWVLDQAAVTSAIVGARNVDQLNDSIKALNLPALSSEVRKRIDEIAPATKSKNAEGVS